MPRKKKKDVSDGFIMEEFMPYKFVAIQHRVLCSEITSILNVLKET